MSLSSVTRAGRTRATESVRQQAHGLTSQVVATTAPAVLAEAATAAAAAAGALHTTDMDPGPMCEDEGESGVLLGSSLKRHKHAGQPDKDSSAKYAKHILSRALSPSLLQAPRVTAPSSPTHSSCHSLGVSCAAPVRSNPDMVQQLSGPISHTDMQLPLLSMSRPTRILPSLVAQPSPTENPSSLSSPQLNEDNTHGTLLLSLNPPCNGGGGGAVSTLLAGQHPTRQEQTEWCEQNKSKTIINIPGYIICLSGGEVQAFMASMGVAVLCIHDVFKCIGHDDTHAHEQMSKFCTRHKGQYEVGGPNLIIKARHPGMRGSKKFAPAGVMLDIVCKYWNHTLDSTKSRLTEGKELLVSDLLALMPKVKDVGKPASDARLLETSGHGCKAAQPCTEAAPKAAAHCTISEDVSSCRMDPVPISSREDPPVKKRNDLFTSMVNVVQYLDLDTAETSEVIEKLHSMTDDDVTLWMATTHQFMRAAWNLGRREVMHSIIKGLVRRGK